MYSIDAQNDFLYAIDPLTGSRAFVGALGLDVDEGGMDFDPTTNALYGVGHLPGIATLAFDPAGFGMLVGDPIGGAFTIFTSRKNHMLVAALMQVSHCVQYRWSFFRCYCDVCARKGTCEMLEFLLWR